MEKTNWVAAVSSGSQPIHCPDHERTMSRASSDRTPRRTKSARRSSSLARTRFASLFPGLISRNGTFARILVPTAARPRRSRQVIDDRNIRLNGLDVSTCFPPSDSATDLPSRVPREMWWRWSASIRGPVPSVNCVPMLIQ